MGRVITGSTDLPKSADVVIIGGGIAGACDAFFLGRQGVRAVVLEARDQLASLTTAQAVACFRAQWDDSRWADLVLPSIAFYENFEAETGLDNWDIGIRHQGWLFLTGETDGPESFERFVAGHRRMGTTDSEFLRPEALRQRFPWVGPAATAGTYRAKDGWLSPYEAAYGLARSGSADFYCGVHARRVVQAGGRIHSVQTDRGEIETSTVVIAAGPYSSRLAESVGVDLPVKMVRRHRAMIGPQPEIDPRGPMVVDVDTHAYWRPEGGGAFLGDGLPEPPSEPTENVPVDWTFPATAMNAACRLVPFWKKLADRVKANEITLGAGQYTTTADGLPLICGTPNVDGLYFHTGDNGWGIESAPEAGHKLAGLVTASAPSGVNPYGLDRSSLLEKASRTVTY
jgi:sarcosine oxidase, subunit beta